MCTGKHPFYINNMGWVKARDLIENDEVIHYNEGVSKINKIYKEVLDAPEDTYNFEVEDCQLGSGFMNKKTNYLAILPVWGTCIVLFILFIKTIKKEITKKKFYMYMFGCGLFGFLSILVAILTLKLINDLTNHETFLDTYGVWIGFIIGGYIMNIFTFILINRHYDELK